MSIGERIKALRNSLRLSQQECCDLTGIPLGTYKKYEGDDRAPGSEALAGLRKLGASIDWLVTGEGQMLLKDLQTPPPAVDARILRLVIEGVEEKLARSHKRLTAARKAQLIVLIYEHVVQTAASEASAINRFMELID